jgi:hypothetical protein
MPITGTSGFGNWSVIGLSRVPKPAAMIIPEFGNLEVVVMEQNLSKLRELRVLEQNPANVLKRIADVLEVSRVASSVEKRSETPNRLKIALYAH